MKRIKNNIIELGLLNGLLYSLNRVYEKLTGKGLIYKYYFYVQPVAKKPLLPSRFGKKYTLLELDKNSPYLKYFDRPKHVLDTRFHNGAKCFCAVKDNIPTGFIWISLGKYQEDEVRCIFNPVPSGENAWDFDVFISPHDRLGFSFALLWDHVNKWLTKQNYKWTSSRVSAFNPNSIRSHSRLGAQRVGYGTFIKISGMEIGLFSKKPYLSISRNNWPVIDIGPHT